MERFKLLEKEMKIKAFSKEGLNQTIKLTPQEKEKTELVSWLKESVELLNSQVEAFEADLDRMGALKKSKSLEQHKTVEEHKKFINAHKFHIEKLEVCLRLLENDQISPARIADIREGVDYYLTSHSVTLYYLPQGTRFC